MNKVTSQIKLVVLLCQSLSEYNRLRLNPSILISQSTSTLNLTFYHDVYLMIYGSLKPLYRRSGRLHEKKEN